MSKAITVAELNPLTHRNKLFRIKLFDLFSSEERQVRDAIYKITEAYGSRKLAPVIHTMVRELAVNALKAVYKKIFYERVIQELGIPEVSYAEWLDLFKAEIDAHRAENFSRIAREEDLGISVYLRFNEDGLSLRVSNQGKPTELEYARIKSAIEQSRQVSNMRALMEEREGQDEHSEGAGMGIAMCIMTLKGLHIPAENFRIELKSTQTVASIELPWQNLLPPSEQKETTILAADAFSRAGSEIIEKLDFAILCFDRFENLIEVSDSFLQKLNISRERVADVKSVIPQRFFRDIFRGVHNIRVVQQFENYRIRLTLPEKGKASEVLFHVNGYLDETGILRTMWQPVVLQELKTRLSEGSILDSLRIQNIIRRYIPQNVLRKAVEMTAAGREELPNEVVNATVLFADIVGFTRLSENMHPLAVIEMLNLALGMVASALVRHGGTIDKYMGDAVFALFDDPLRAVAAAVEIQNLYIELNALRELKDQPPIEMRIGIHSGKVIMGNIGSAERLDWTAIGDVVNTASRIEQNSAGGQVLISDSTYSMVKERVEWQREMEISVKGKVEQLKVYFVKSVSFQRQEKMQKLQIPVPLSLSRQTAR